MIQAFVDDTVSAESLRASRSACRKSGVVCSGIDLMEAIGLMGGKSFLPLAYSSVIHRTMLGHSKAVDGLNSRKVVTAENPVSYALGEVRKTIERLVVTLGHISSQTLCSGCFVVRLPRMIRTSRL
jgi:hypothetical protein